MVISMSPKELSACSSISFARPDSPAPSAAVARRMRRPVLLTTLPVRSPAAEALRTRTFRDTGWSSGSDGSSGASGPSASAGASGSAWSPVFSGGGGAYSSPSPSGQEESRSGCGPVSSAGRTESCCRGTAPGSEVGPEGPSACGTCSACCDGVSSATWPSCLRKPRQTRECEGDPPTIGGRRPVVVSRSITWAISPGFSGAPPGCSGSHRFPSGYRTVVGARPAGSLHYARAEPCGRRGRSSDRCRVAQNRWRDGTQRDRSSWQRLPEA